MPHDGAIPKQTQAMVVDWCRTHYPGETRAQMVRNLVEEVGELANELDVDVEDLVAVLRKSMARGKEGTPEAIRGEFGDVMVSIYNLAGKSGEDAHQCLDAKMFKLSTRTVAESLERVQKKKALGLRNDIGAD